MTNVARPDGASITGGANGIGLGIARAFAGAGAKLALVDLEEGALAAAKEELSAVTQVETFVLDVRDRAAFAPIADQVEARLGPVSLVVNNAGVAGGAAAHKMTYALWDWGMGVNLDGVISGVQTFLPRWPSRAAVGRIVAPRPARGWRRAAAGCSTPPPSSPWWA